MMPIKNNSPVLYVVATPIGHLSDLSAHAQQVLSQVDKIYAEDTRHTQHLLSHWGISQSLVRLDAHRELQSISKVLADLAQGLALALVSDAGTPAISDPGAKLVRAVHQAGYAVRVVAGPSSLSAAISVSGIDASAGLVFLGFLPRQKSEQKTLWQSWVFETRPWLAFEAPHRLKASLQQCHNALGAVPLVLCKELTKSFETTRWGTPEEHLAWLEQDLQRIQGEWVWLMPPPPQAQSPLPPCSPRQLMSLLLHELPPTAAVRVAEGISGLKREQLYALAVELKNNEEPPQGTAE